MSIIYPWTEILKLLWLSPAKILLYVERYIYSVAVSGSWHRLWKMYEVCHKKRISWSSITRLNYVSVFVVKSCSHESCNVKLLSSTFNLKQRSYILLGKDGKIHNSCEDFSTQNVFTLSRESSSDEGGCNYYIITQCSLASYPTVVLVRFTTTNFAELFSHPELNNLIPPLKI